MIDDRGNDASPVPISARGSAYAYRVEHGAQRVRQRFNRKRLGDIHRTASGARLKAPGGRHRLCQCSFACALGQVRYRLARCWTATSLDQHQQGLGTWALAFLSTCIRHCGFACVCTAAHPRALPAPLRLRMGRQYGELVGRTTVVRFGLRGRSNGQHPTSADSWGENPYTAHENNQCTSYAWFKRFPPLYQEDWEKPREQ